MKFDFVANLPMSLTVKEFSKNRLTFWEVMGKSLVSCSFFETQCIWCEKNKAIVDV